MNNSINLNFLLIYASADDPESVADYLPAGGASVLITSRFFDWGDWVQEVPLNVLPLLAEIRHHMRDAGALAGPVPLDLAEICGKCELLLTARRLARKDCDVVRENGRNDRVPGSGGKGRVRSIPAMMIPPAGDSLSPSTGCGISVPVPDRRSQRLRGTPASPKSQ